MRRYEILIIEANCLFLELYAKALSLNGYGVTRVRTGKDGVAALHNGVFDLLLSDDKLDKEENIAQILKEARELQPAIKIIVATSNSGRDRDPAFQAIGLTAENFLRKGRSIDQVVERAHMVLAGEMGQFSGIIKTETPPSKRMIPGLSVLLHDIRSPLVCIASQLQLLRKGKFGQLPETTRAEVDKIIARCTGLTQMAEEYLLAIAHEDKIADQPPLEAPCLIEEIIDPVLHELAVDMRENGNILTNQIEKNIFSDRRVFINGGKVWLKSVFRNLLSNAIKYGEKGGTIEIDIEKKTNHYQVNVVNSVSSISERNGEKASVSEGEAIDVPKENIPKRGMGVGLLLTRKIVDYYGGEIWHEAGEDCTKFIFTLPYGAALSGEAE